MSLGLKGFVGDIVSLALIYLVAQVLMLPLLFYKRCPCDKILVARKKRRGMQDKYRISYLKGIFYNPFVEEIKVLYLAPMVCDVNIENVKTKDGVLVLSFPITFTYAIDTRLKEIAAEKLIDFNVREIEKLGQKIIQEQMNNIVRDITYKQLNFDVGGFCYKVNTDIDKVLNKYGMYIINMKTEDLEVEENIER